MKSGIVLLKTAI